MSLSAYREKLDGAAPYAIVLGSMLALFVLTILAARPLYKVVGANAHGTIGLVSSEIYVLGERWSNMYLDVAHFYNLISLITIGTATMFSVLGVLWGEPGAQAAGGYLTSIGLILASASSRYYLTGIDSLDVRLVQQLPTGLIDLGRVTVEPAGPVRILEVLAGGLVPLVGAAVLFLLASYIYYTGLGVSEGEAGNSGRA